MLEFIKQMLNPRENFVCIHCANEVKELHKKYSSTVLKLTTCGNCKQVADKYIEYDPVIIIIDLVLLNREAYFHVLYNTSFSIHWKLLIILQLMEAYSDWTLSFPSKNYTYNNKKPIILDNFFTGDFEFYKTFFKVTIRTALFSTIIFLLTVFYNLFFNKKKPTKALFVSVWKCVVLSGFGIFLLLPSLIWDVDIIQEYHYIFVSLYITLTQLVTYTVICDCSKFWSIFVIITAYFCKIFYFNAILANI